MKNKEFNKREYLLNALVIVLSVIGGIIAVVLYRYYAYVAKGILGIVVLYLLYFYDKSKRMDRIVDALLFDPQKSKHLMSVLVYGIISGWAMIQIAAVILFYLQK